MKKIGKFIVKNMLGIIIGIILTTVTGVSAAILLKGTEIIYNNETSGLQSQNVQGAIDELYDKVNNMVPIDPDTFQTNTAKTVYASSKGVCISRNGKLNCFKTNNWDEEQNHIKQVFSDISCSANSCKCQHKMSHLFQY